MEGITKKVDKPFDPDRSVVIYGLVDAEAESLDQTVSWLISMVLGLTITPKFYERTTSKSEKPGVIKVELKDAYDKVAMLRAKKKCEDVARTKKVKISSCDSHESRVSKLNARFILSKLPGAKNFIVTGNGVIREKQVQEDGELPADEGNEDDMPIEPS